MKSPRSMFKLTLVGIVCMLSGAAFSALYPNYDYQQTFDLTITFKCDVTGWTTTPVSVPGFVYGTAYYLAQTGAPYHATVKAAADAACGQPHNVNLYYEFTLDSTAPWGYPDNKNSGGYYNSDTLHYSFPAAPPCQPGYIRNGAGTCVEDTRLCSDYSEERFFHAYDSNVVEKPSGSMCFEVDTDLSCISTTGLSVCSLTGGCATTVYPGAEECTGTNNNGTLITETCSQLTTSGFCLDESGPGEVKYYDDQLKDTEAGTDEICFTHNGGTVCQQITEFDQSCGYLNGEQYCFDSSTTYIDPNSPDHPNNGGNGDGNPYNDILSGDPLDEPTQQEQKEIDFLPVTNAIRDQTNDINEAAQLLQAENQQFLLDEFTEELPDTLMSKTGTTEGNLDSILAKAAEAEGYFDDIAGHINSADDGDGYFTERTKLEAASDYVTLGYGSKFDASCQDYNWALGSDFTFIVECSNFSRARELIGFALWLLFAYFVFHIMNQTVKEVAQ